VYIKEKAKINPEYLKLSRLKIKNSIKTGIKTPKHKMDNIKAFLKYNISFDPFICFKTKFKTK